MPDTLDIRVDDGETPSVLVAGDLDMAGAPALVEAVAALCSKEPRAILIDIAGVRFLDSGGLRALLEVSSICEQHGCELSLSPPAARVRRVLELSGVLDVLPFRDAAGENGDGPGPAAGADGAGPGRPAEAAPDLRRGR